MNQVHTEWLVHNKHIYTTCSKGDWKCSSAIYALEHIFQCALELRRVDPTPHPAEPHYHPRFGPGPLVPWYKLHPMS